MHFENNLHLLKLQRFFKCHFNTNALTDSKYFVRNVEIFNLIGFSIECFPPCSLVMFITLQLHVQLVIAGITV